MKASKLSPRSVAPWTFYTALNTNHVNFHYSSFISVSENNVGYYFLSHVINGHLTQLFDYMNKSFTKTGIKENSSY